MENSPPSTTRVAADASTMDIFNFKPAPPKNENPNLIEILYSMAYNTVILIFGAGAFIYTLYAYDQSTFIRTIEAKGQYKFGVLLLTVAGVLSILLSIVGYIAFLPAMHSFRKCVLMGYLVVLVIVIILYFVSGVYGIMFKGSVETNIREGFKKAAFKYQVDKSSAIKDAIDQIQSKFKCCGVLYDGLIHPGLMWERDIPGFSNSPKDYIAPMSCCKCCSNECMFQLTPENSYMENDCCDNLVPWIQHKGGMLSNIAIPLSVLLLPSAIFGAVLLATKSKLLE